MLTSLVRPLLLEVISLLDTDEKFSFRQVCKYFRTIVDEEVLQFTFPKPIEVPSIF